MEDDAEVDHQVQEVFDDVEVLHDGDDDGPALFLYVLLHLDHDDLDDAEDDLDVVDGQEGAVHGS